MTVRPRVLLVDHSSVIGGAERALLAAAKGLMDRFELEAVCPGDGDLADAFDHARIPVHPTVVADLRLTRPVAMARTVDRMLALLADRTPDVVLLNGLRSLKVCLCLGERRPAVLAFVHDVVTPQTSSRGLRAFGYFRNRVARYVTPCEAAKVSLGRAGIPAGRIDVVPPGSEPHGPLAASEREALLRSLGLDPTRPVVGFVGQVEPRKGVDVYLDALAGLARAQFVLVGDDPFGEHRNHRDHVLDRARAKGRPLLLGWRHDAPRITAALDVLVCPSHADACPLVVLEAMAAGVAVVASRVGGVPEQLGDDEAGLLVWPGDAAALGAAIQRLVDDAELRARLGAAGRRRYLGTYGLDRVTGALAESLARTLEGV